MPTERDQHGNLNNVVVVKAQVPEYDSNTPLHSDLLSTSPIESYDFSLLPQEDHTTEPPTLPRLLSRVPFDQMSSEPCEGVNFVRLNHMYSAKSDRVYGCDEVRTLATETRYKAKVVTTILIAAKNTVASSMNLNAARPYGHKTVQRLSTSQSTLSSVPPKNDESRSLILDALNNV